MALDTKPNLNSEKFEQFTGDILNISGTTRIFGNIEYAGSAPLNFSNNSLVKKSYVDGIVTTGTTSFNRDINATTSSLYAFKSNTTFKGQGQVILTNGSGSISGISTNFLNATEPTGVSFWFAIDVKDSANNWYRINLATIPTNTTATISRVHSRSLIRGGSLNVSGNVNIPTAPSTFTGVTGTYDYYLGFRNWSDGRFSLAMGNASYAENYGVSLGGSSVAAGLSSFALGLQSFALGEYSIGMGAQSRATGNYSVAMGFRSQATGLYSVAFGINALAQGESSFVIGRGWDVAGSASDRPVIAAGFSSINLSRNDASQTSGHGALADLSAIIGGINNNIPSNSTGSVIIGGNTVKALSADTNTVYLPKVRIGWGTGSALTSGSTSNDVIVRSTGGILQTRTIASLVSGSTVTANNGLTKSGNNIGLGGALTGNTIVSLGTNSIDFTGTTSSAKLNTTNVDSRFGYQVSGTTLFNAGSAVNALQIGQNSIAIGGGSVAIGVSSNSIGDNSVAIGNSAVVNSTQGIAIGLSTSSTGQGTIALGYSAKAQSFVSISIGTLAGATTGIDNSETISIGGAANYGTADIGQRSIAIGSSTISKGGGDIAIGYLAGNTTGTSGGQSISLGYNANQGISTIGFNSIAIGSDNESSTNGSIAIGASTIASGGTNNIAIGVGTKARNQYDIAIGNDTNVNGGGGGSAGIGIGGWTISTGASATAIGYFAHAGGTWSHAIGRNARTKSIDQISIGTGAGLTSGTHGTSSISIGRDSNQGTSNIGTNSIAIGVGSKGLGSSSLSIGNSAGSTTGTVGEAIISIGALANAGTSNVGTDSIAIGTLSKSIVSNSIAIGTNIESNAIGAINLGWASPSIRNSSTDSFQLSWNAHDDYKLIKGTVSTTNATQTTVLSYPLLDSSIYSIKATVKARGTAGVERALFSKQALFYRQGGGAVLEGVVHNGHNDVHTNNSIAATLDASGNDVRVRVTGLAATTFNWHVILEVQRVG